MSHLHWPAGLRRCSLVVPSCSEGPHPAGARAGVCSVAPCSCAACGAAGFWGSLRSLHVSAAGCPVELSLPACVAALRSCDSIEIEAAAPGCGGAVQAAAAAEDELLAAAAGAPTTPLASLREPDLQPWLAALAPLCAATPLRSFRLRATAAAVHAGEGTPAALRAAGSLQALGAVWARLAGAALAANHCQVAVWQNGGVRLTAQLAGDVGRGRFCLDVSRG